MPQHKRSLGMCPMTRRVEERASSARQQGLEPGSRMTSRLSKAKCIRLTSPPSGSPPGSAVMDRGGTRIEGSAWEAGGEGGTRGPGGASLLDAESSSRFQQ
ncbi:unnamed protein product [Rangifer tarandus platyrhynchus]|uniref:Uncharacterized protein n=1 Tax=Rangifer tarandus platyrhynchus TaxID=3082113 RepID=A0AC59Z709_RANTA